MRLLPCAWCDDTAWVPHCVTVTICRWLRCDTCGALYDVQAHILLPPISSGEGPLPAE